MPAVQHGDAIALDRRGSPRAPGRVGNTRALTPSMQWTSDAEQQLKEVPFFVRPVVRRRIESLAAEAGRIEVDAPFYEEAKARFGEK